MTETALRAALMDAAGTLLDAANALEDTARAPAAAVCRLAADRAIQAAKA